MKIILTCLAVMALSVTHAWAQVGPDDPDSIAGVMKVRHEEAGAMRTFPGVATREGNRLTISRNGRPVARFTDHDIGHCDGFENCSVWHFVGEVTLRTETGKLETYVEVFHFIGEGGDFRLVATDGAILTLDDYPLASPDHRFAAVGETEGENDGYLSIIDWASPGHRVTADFKSACEPIKWLDAGALKVICSNWDKTTIAVVKHLGSTWRLDDVAAADERTQKPLPKARFKPFGESAVTSTAATPSAKDQADGDAYDREAGYEKLN